MTWIVIAMALGDGDVGYGRRLWSHEFQSYAAALEAFNFLNTDDNVGKVILITDWPSKPTVAA